MAQEDAHGRDSQRAWELLLDRIKAVEESVDRAAERDDEAWAEYRAKCEVDEKAKSVLLADTAAMVERTRAETAKDVERVRVLIAQEVERLRVEIAAAVEANRVRLAGGVDKRLKAVWRELRGRPGATRPPFWHHVSGRFLIICGLIALALLALIFNARNLGEFCGTLLAKLAGQ